jgi:hypothetical protein
MGGRYAATADGERFLVNIDDNADTRAINVVLNWPAALKNDRLSAAAERPSRATGATRGSLLQMPPGVERAVRPVLVAAAAAPRASAARSLSPLHQTTTGMSIASSCVP